MHECRERNIHVIKHNLDILGKNKIIHIGDKPFTCTKKYLQHVLDHHHNEYMPRDRITKVIEKINHFEKHLEKQHAIHHGFVA